MVNATLREVATAFDPEPATEDLSVQAAALGLTIGYPGTTLRSTRLPPCPAAIHATQR